MKEVIIVGAGFAGRSVAERLSKSRLFNVTLIDKNCFISYKPLFPDVASGKLCKDIINYPLKKYAEKKKINCISGEITSIITGSNTIVINNQKLRYDFLVVATGVEENFYGNYNFREYVYPIASLSQCEALSDALRNKLSSSEGSIRITIVGSGYTGVEMAANLRSLTASYNKIPDITILEANDKILPGMPDWVRDRIVKYFNKWGIKTLTNSKVTQISGSNIHLENKIIPAGLIIWTAGMAGSGIAEYFHPVNKDRRIDVNDTLNPKGLKNVFIAGDASSKCRMSVPIAKQYASYIAKAIIKFDSIDSFKPFKAKDYGYIIPLSGFRGIGKLGVLPVDGAFGYIFHYAMCALSLLGLKNKVKLLMYLIKTNKKARS